DALRLRLSGHGDDTGEKGERQRSHAAIGSRKHAAAHFAGRRDFSPARALASYNESVDYIRDAAFRCAASQMRRASPGTRPWARATRRDPRSGKISKSPLAMPAIIARATVCGASVFTLPAIAFVSGGLCWFSKASCGVSVS